MDAVGLGGPLLEGLDGAGVAHMDGRDVTQPGLAVYLLVDEFVAEIDGLGILLRVAVKYLLDTCPIKRREAHRARLTAAIYNAISKLESVQFAACVANRIHFGVRRRVIVERHRIGTGRDDHAVTGNHGAERAAAKVHIVARKLVGQIHQFGMKIFIFA